MAKILEIFFRILFAKQKAGRRSGRDGGYKFSRKKLSSRRFVLASLRYEYKNRPRERTASLSSALFRELQIFLNKLKNSYWLIFY